MPATNYFGTIDYVFMAIYAIVLIGLGIYLKGRASESLEDYITGGKKVPWWAMGISGMAQFLDLTGTALIVSFLFMLGPQGLFIEFRGGAVLILVFMMLWIGKWQRRSGCLTGAEWNIFRFGDCWGGRFAQLMSVVAICIVTIGMLAYLTTGVGIFLSSFLPFSPKTCAYTLIALAAIYTMVSGFYGVIFTDLFQSVIILVAVVYVSVKAFFAVSGADEVAALALEVTGNPDWMSSVPQWQASMPSGYENYKALIPLMILYLFKNMLDGASKIGDPKYFGAKNDRECGKLTALWTIVMTVRWPMMMGIAVLGLFVVKDLIPDQAVLEQASVVIRELNPDVTRSTWGALISSISYNPADYPPAMVAQLRELLGEDRFVEKLSLLSFDGTVNPEKILPTVLLTSIGEGLRGIIILALIAASMSTFDTTVNMATGMVVNDVYRKYLRPTAKTKELIYASWGTVVILVGFGILMANNVDSIEDIWGWLMLSLGGAFFVPNLLRLYWWRFNGMGTAVGSLVGMTAAITQRWIFPDLGEVWLLFYSLSAGMIGGIIATFCDKPTDPEVLKNFYMKTRPFGFWGHLKRQLPEAERKKVSDEHFYDLISVPFALLWQVTMFLAPMLLVIHSWKGFAITSALWVVGGAGLYWFWYRRLPETNFYNEEATNLDKV
ncbi:MAG: sodium:solute symporter [Akkermansiaceae bacterium]